MIDWVQDYGIIWGINQRRVEFGGVFRPDGTFHFDGSMAKSAAARVFEGHGGHSQYFAEVLTGESLLFRRAMQGLNEARIYLLFYRYVIPKGWMSTKQKINALMDMFPDVFKNRQSFYDELDRTHERIAAVWPTLVPREANCSDTVAA